MFFLSAQKKIIFGGCLLLLVGILGCDKIPFLSKFFPSVVKEKSQEATPAAPVAQTAPVESAPAANVVAKVGSWTMTTDEFNEKLKILKEAIPDFDTSDLESKKLVLEELVRQQLLVADAEKSGIARKREITDAIDEFRKTLLVREMASKISEGVEATDTEARDYYDKNKAQFANPAEWHIREIIVPTQEEAKEILIEILKGADFAATAQARSKSTSATNGGDLGFIKDENLKAEVRSALSSLDVGAVSSVFKGPDGNYQIVKLEEKKGGEPKKFDDVKAEVKTGLTLMKQQQKILAYIEDLKKNTTVITNEELLK